jgi:diacylglycerol kinase family enzyme
MFLIPLKFLFNRHKNEIQHGPIRHVSLFYNPTSRGGKGKKLTNKLQKKLAKVDGYTVEFFNTLDDESLKIEVQNCIQLDRCIAICGGDGYSLSRFLKP